MKGADDWRYWQTFIRAAYYLLRGYGPAEEEALAREFFQIRLKFAVERRETYLRGRGSTPLDGMLPWLFRAVRQDPAAVVGGHSWTQKLSEIADWYVGARPNIMRFSWDEARAAQHVWHLEMEAKENAVTMQRLPVAKSWPDGFTIRRVEDLGLLLQIGKSLGHCYKHATTARSYLRRYGIYTLFDAAGIPRVTTVLRPAEVIEFQQCAYGHRPGDWRSVGECKGTQNKPPREEFYSYLYAWLTGVLGPLTGGTAVAWDEAIVAVPDGKVLAKALLFNNATYLVAFELSGRLETPFFVWFREFLQIRFKLRNWSPMTPAPHWEVKNFRAHLTFVGHDSFSVSLALLEDDGSLRDPEAIEDDGREAYRAADDYFRMRNRRRMRGEIP